ncbi:uncharacterized protein LOC105663067 [Megachile rotundata]|uniref:uncharacterized protein LOC105663067 n=1 Tax=Megachile rotundata TaxID=143995 RepID=UPI0006150035|nr:PREDICTED: uncharacterized protein LOC105663067 [Megachile rotundata]
MRQLLLVFVIYEVLKPVECVNGVIWNKQSGNFVPIFSIPSFAAMRDEIFKKSLEKETHNFQGEIVRFSYYEIINMVKSEANGTKVTGVIGEVWNTLSDYLNFTLKPILSEYQTLGAPLPNGSYDNGLLKTIQLNKTDVIARVEARHSSRLKATQFSLPLWKTQYRLYIRRQLKFRSDWMLKLFSRKVWYSILWMYLLLTVCSYVSQKAGIVLSRRDLIVDLKDHLFYNFGTIIGQIHPWECVSKSARIVNLWMTIFSFFIKTAYNALILNYIWSTTVTIPFDDLHSLVQDTSYNVLTLSGSLPNILFQENLSDHVEVLEHNRHFEAATMEDLFKLGCSREKRWAIYLAADMKKASGLMICRLNPVGKSLFHSYIVSGISWNFEYKRTIDRGILKLHETGIMKMLQHRWLESKNVEDENKFDESESEEDDIYFVISTFTAVILLALAVLAVEYLIFYYNKRN